MLHVNPITIGGAVVVPAGETGAHPTTKDANNSIVIVTLVNHETPDLRHFLERSMYNLLNIYIPTSKSQDQSKQDYTAM